MLVQPNQVRLLVEACRGNGSEAARRLGVSPGFVTASLRKDEISQPYDLAAKAVLADMRTSKGGTSADDVRDMMQRVAVYASRTPALEMPRDIFDMLGKTVAEVSRELL